MQKYAAFRKVSKRTVDLSGAVTKKKIPCKNDEETIDMSESVKSFFEEGIGIGRGEGHRA